MVSASASEAAATDSEGNAHTQIPAYSLASAGFFRHQSLQPTRHFIRSRHMVTFVATRNRRFSDQSLKCERKEKKCVELLQGSRQISLNSHHIPIKCFYLGVLHLNPVLYEYAET